MNLTKADADALCTLVTLGFIEKNIVKLTPVKFIFSDEKEAADSKDLVDVIRTYGINGLEIARQEPKIQHHLVLAKTDYLNAEGLTGYQDDVLWTSQMLEQDLSQQSTREAYTSVKAVYSQDNDSLTSVLAWQPSDGAAKVTLDTLIPLNGGYIGGKINTGVINFLGASSLYLYDRPASLAGDSLKEDTVIDSFYRAKMSTDALNYYVTHSIGMLNSKKGTHLHFGADPCPAIASVTPSKYLPGSLFASIHGLVNAIYAYGLSKKGAGIENTATCCELALGAETEKSASCIPCSIFASSNGTPANFTHFGRGDNWNLPKGTAGADAKKTAWVGYVFDCFQHGMKRQNVMDIAPVNALVTKLNAERLMNASDVSDLFLLALTYDDKFIRRILNTLK